MTRGDKAIRWIENFCIYPHGFNKGQFVVLTTEQKEIVRAVFDTDNAPKSQDRWPLIWRCFILPVRAIWRCTFPQFRSVPTPSQLGTRLAPICAPW